MADDGPWQRFRRSRTAGVLAVYAGAAWVVLQLIDVLDGIVPLPEWLGPAALILLAIGLVVVLATAFVQGASDARRRAEAEEVPGAWELDLDRIDDELRAGRVPHLTWARAALGGVVAFSLLFGAAGFAAYLTSRDGGDDSPPSLAAAEAPEPGLAVLPFDLRVTDEDLEVWDEGLVVTVAANLDGVEGVRTIDYGTVLARWAEAVPEGRVPDLETALAAARAAGAEWAVRGSLLEIGDDVRIDASVRSVGTGETLEQIRVEGAADSIVPLIDRLSVEILRAILPERGLEGGIGLEGVASASPEAVKAWVEGERDFRLGRFEDADDAFLRAVGADSSFALAWLRLSQSRGWRRNTFVDEVVTEVEAYRQAARHVRRLSPRERMLLRAQGALAGQDSISIDSLRAFVRRHPDDAEAWAQLGEQLYHTGTVDAMTLSDEAFEEAVALQPQFVPYHIHAVDLAFQLFADRTLAQRRVERLERVAPESPQARSARIAYQIAYGSPEEIQAAREALVELPLQEHLYQLIRLSHPFYARVQEQVARLAASRPDFPPESYDDFTLGGLQPMTSVGSVEQALRYLSETRNPSARLCGPARLLVGVGMPLAESSAPYVGRPAVEEYLSGSGRSASDAALASGLDCAWLIARWQERSDDAAHWTRVRDSLISGLPADERATAQQQARVTAAVDESLESWRSGDAQAALAGLRALPERIRTAPSVRRLSARLLLDLDRPEGALEMLAPLGVDALAELDRARALEALGRDAEAREAYEFFLAGWQPDLPELSVLADSATAGLARIAARLN